MSHDPPLPRARASWSPASRRTFREILSNYSDLDAASLTTVYAAIDLLSDADKMHQQIIADGLVAEGSQGQPVAHPLIAEARVVSLSAHAVRYN